MSADLLTPTTVPGRSRRRPVAAATRAIVAVQLRDPEDHQLLNPDGWTQVQQRALTLADALLARHGGTRNPNSGDLIQLRFNDIGAALRWSLALQESLRRSQMPAPWNRASCAVGVQIGPFSESGSWTGATTESAVALCRAAPPGGMLAADDAWRAALRMIPGGLIQSEDLGTCRFPGIEGATRAWWLYGADVDRPQGTAKVVPPHTNLPADPDAFFGRSLELEDLDQMFRSGAAAVVLVGPGGIGKSRLAQRYAALHLHEYAEEGGVWSVDLTEAHSVESFTELVAHVLEAPLQALPSPIEQLGRALDERGRILVVLDDPAPELLDLPAILEQWSQLAPRARFLVNAIQRRGMLHEYEVGSLDSTAATQLFAHCASRIRSDFSLEREQHGVLQVVERVDSVPLAIELAAAWVDLLSPQQLFERLANDLAVLSENPSRPDQTLTAVMESSWKQLDRWQQMAMEQISAFRGGFSLEALDAVLVFPEGYSAPTTMQILTELRRKSLVQLYEPDARPGSLRFSTNALVQDFANQRLRRSGRHAAVYRKHAEWVLGLGERLAHNASRGDGDALAGLSIERQNLTVVCDRLRAHGGTALVRALLTLQPLYEIRGPWSTWQTLAEEAVAQAVRAPLQVRVLAHQALAEALLARGRPEEALTTLDEAVEELQELGKRIPRLEAPLHIRIGRARLALGDPESALDSAEYAQAMAVDAHHKGVARSISARAHAALGQLDLAQRTQSEAAEQLRQCGAKRDEALARQHLGDLFRTSGSPEDAQDLYDTARVFHEAQRDRPLMAMLEHRLGTLNLDLNQIETARKHFDSAAKSFAEIGDARAEALVRGDLARLEHLSNRPREALSAFRRAHRSLGELGDRRFHAIHLANEGSLLHELDRIADARSALQSALSEIQEVGDQRFVRLIALRLAALECDQGDVAAARRAFATAEAVDIPMDSVGAAALKVHQSHLPLAETQSDPRLHNSAKQHATRVWHEISGTAQVPGIAARSADVRLATRLLARRLRRGN